MPEPQTASQRLGKHGAEFRQALIERMAKGYNGGKQSDAVDINHDKELDLYLRPTGPAAQEALRMGGTMEQAVEADRMWANEMRNRQQMIRQQMVGVPEEQIAAALKEQQLTDEQIFMTARKHAYELGKQYGHDDPEEEVKWHEKMTKRVAERRAGQMTYQTIAPEGVIS